MEIDLFLSYSPSFVTPSSRCLYLFITMNIQDLTFMEYYIFWWHTFRCIPSILLLVACKLPLNSNGPLFSSSYYSTSWSDEVHCYIRLHRYNYVSLRSRMVNKSLFSYHCKSFCVREVCSYVIFKLNVYSPAYNGYDNHWDKN